MWNVVIRSNDNRLCQFAFFSFPILFRMQKRNKTKRNKICLEKNSWIRNERNRSVCFNLKNKTTELMFSFLLRKFMFHQFLGFQMFQVSHGRVGFELSIRNRRWMTIFLNLNFINFYFYIVIGGANELVVTVKNAKQYNLILRRDRIKTNSNGTSKNNTNVEIR